MTGHEEEKNTGVRLQKVLANAGVASRRNCETLIARGVVRVNGEVVREMGSRVDPHNDVIHVEGKRILLDDSHVTIAVNKPVGVVSTMTDPQGRPTLAKYARGFGAKRLFHVGRLDTDTEGLILLTNDGELANRLTHPSHQVTKTYLAEVKGTIGRGVGRELRAGIDLDDGYAAVDRFTVKGADRGYSLVELDVHIGKNRIVRRILAAVGYPVVRLVRTRIGPITLDGLTPGKSRRLSRDEVSALMAEVGL